MDKEGQPIQFSSDKISEKQKPDFFVASNEKAERRKRFSPKTTFSKIGGFFKSLGVKLSDYFKHPFRGRHKIATIIGIIAIIVAIVLITLNITLWSKNTAKDPTPLSDEELEKWGIEVASVIYEGSQLPDEDFRTYYANLINDEKKEQKAIDLSIIYANELSIRGYVDLSLDLLNSLDKDDMYCFQIMRYYEAYAAANLALANGTINSDVDYYNDLTTDQETFCLTGEYPEKENTSDETLEEYLEDQGTGNGEAANEE